MDYNGWFRQLGCDFKIIILVLLDLRVLVSTIQFGYQLMGNHNKDNHINKIAKDNDSQKNESKNRKY